MQLSTALVLVAALAAPCAADAAGAADYAKAAQEAAKKGDLQTAEIELRNAVKADPQNAAYRFDLAEVELSLNDPASAERDARAAADRGYDKHKATLLLGETLLRQGRGKDLLAEFVPSGDDPELKADIYVLRGQAQMQNGDRAAAQNSFAQAEQIYPNGVAAWIADARLALADGEVWKAKDRVAHALALQPKSPEVRELNALVLQFSGDRDGALDALNKLIAEQPQAIPALLQRAGLLLSMNKRDEARKDVEAALALDPRNPQARFYQAELQLADGKNRDAEATLQKLQPLFPYYPRGYLLMAMAAARNGETQVAEDSAATYISHVPQDVSGYALLAELYLRSNRPDLALQPLNQAVQAGKTNAAIYQMLGQSEMAVRRPDLAADAFAKLRELVPDNVQAIAESAGALAAAGRFDDALSLLQQSLTKNPTSPELQAALVSTALSSGDIGKANAALAEVKKSGGSTPEVENLTAAVQMADLDADGAVATLQKLVKEKPDLLAARTNLARALSLAGRGQEAEAELKTVLQADPASEPALSIMVANAERTNRMADAVALLEKAHQAQTANAGLSLQLGAAYLRAGQPDKALALAQEMDKQSGQPTVGSLHLKADAEIALKQQDDARDTLNALLKLEPRDVNARRQLVSLLIQRKDYEAARTVLTEGMAATPRNYQLEFDYALVDLKASGLQKALQTADSLQREDQTFAPLAALRGDVYLAAGQPEDAVKAYEQAMATTPSTLLVTRLAAAYEKAGQLDKAHTVLADWIAKNPADYTVLATLSEVDIALHRLNDAQAELKKVAAADPRNGLILNNLAWVSQQLGDKDALAIAQKAYLLAPSPQTADTLGWILTEQGEPAKGADLLRQAVVSGDPRIAYHLAVALKDTGQKDEAVKLLDAVVKVQGTFGEKADAEKLLGEMTKGS
ncbi:MAG TPA: XrtA/PEP-CTERM system TPR-repeat protein PrsT [Acetobacteraceae bacterium]|nr:XrtA/PEP-CTERM system TPR-repeat protein PrsT [Acetobacteraceae bacterium]